ncbi:DUF6299 family protein [Nocardia sp. NPDC051832]|uniref:DUF6299 family protein n=1 Tax=Nocardia sp. NPDC051832 TaxID=3155673 RepID=UPI0034126591
MIAENLRTAGPGNRFLRMAIAAVVGCTGAAALAGPASAAPVAQLTAAAIQQLNADGTVRITGTYTCTGGPGETYGSTTLTQGDPADATLSYTEERPSAPVCDGTAHDYAITLPAPEVYPFQPGPARLLVLWDFYTADGNISRGELDQVTVTLQR